MPYLSMVLDIRRCRVPNRSLWIPTPTPTPLSLFFFVFPGKTRDFSNGDKIEVEFDGLGAFTTTISA